MAYNSKTNFQPKGCKIFHQKAIQLFIKRLSNFSVTHDILPSEYQAIIWMNTDVLMIGPLQTNLSSKIFIKHTNVL